MDNISSLIQHNQEKMFTDSSKLQKINRENQTELHADLYDVNPWVDKSRIQMNEVISKLQHFTKKTMLEQPYSLPPGESTQNV